VLLDLCEPFLDPTNPLTSKIDLRFLSRVTPGGKGSGAGRFDASNEAVLSKFVSEMVIMSEDKDAAVAAASGRGDGKPEAGSNPDS